MHRRRSRRRDPLATLTGLEREVLGLMAEGRSNVAVAEGLVVSAGAVEKHVRNIFTKLDLPPDPDDHRRVLAVLRYGGPDAPRPHPPPAVPTIGLDVQGAGTVRVVGDGGGASRIEVVDVGGAVALT